MNTLHFNVCIYIYTTCMELISNELLHRKVRVMFFNVQVSACACACYEFMHACVVKIFEIYIIRPIRNFTKCWHSLTSAYHHCMCLLNSLFSQWANINSFPKFLPFLYIYNSVHIRANLIIARGKIDCLQLIFCAIFMHGIISDTQYLCLVSMI